MTDSSGTHSSETYSWVNRNGSQRAKKDSYKVITEEFYDAYGNKLSTQTFNEDNLDGERFITEYVYYEEDASLRRLPDEVIENGIKTKYVYEDNTYLLKEVIIGNQRIKYEYDVFLEKMMSVSFVDMLTNKTVATYKLFYDENNNIKNVTDNKGIDHSFSDKIEYDYNYNKFYQNQNQYYNNKLVQSNKSYDSMKFINNNYIRGSKTIQYITDDISNESLVAYDKYERIVKHQENDKEILYQYGSDELYKDLNKITDPYSNQDYEYLYDESNNNYGYKVSESNNSNYKLKLTNLPNRVEYSFNNDEYCKSSYTIHENNKSIIDEVFKNEKVKKYINDILAGEEILVSPRVFSTIELDSDVNSKNMEFMHLYLYDSLGRIKSNVNPLYCYIDDGSSSESSDSKVLTINKYYKNDSNLVSSTVEKLNTFPHNSVAFSNQLVYNEYSYDNLGNVTKVNQTGIYFYKNSENKLYNTNLTPYTKEYEYDSFNRLVKEITEVDNENISTIIYKYNDLGYLSKVLKDEALQKEFIYDNGRLVKYNKYGLTYDIMYDNYGNMLTSYNHDYTYNNSNKLSKVYLIDSKKTIENKYNYQGIRCEKIIKDKDGNIENKIKYYLDDKKIHREDRLDRNNNIINTIRYYYDINGICGLRYNNKNYTLIKDELGNISRIMYQGILVAEYRYDAWGNSTIKYYSTDTDEKEAANINPFRYKGYYWDRETNLYYCNYRYYSPEICRWISPDSIEYLDPRSVSGLNLYAYCGNDPVNHIDPNGHAWYHLLIGGAVVIGTVALAIATGGASLAVAAATGAVIGSSTGAIAGGITFDDGEIGWDWEGASVGFCSGSITGTISGVTGEVFSALAPITQVVGNMTLAGTMYTMQGIISKEPISSEGFLVTTLFGGLGGFLGLTNTFAGTFLRSTATSVGLGIAEMGVGELMEYFQSKKSMFFNRY